MSAINVDPGQMPNYVASNLGLHCLLMFLLRVPEWFKGNNLPLMKQIISYKD